MDSDFPFPLAMGYIPVIVPSCSGGKLIMQLLVAPNIVGFES